MTVLQSPCYLVDTKQWYKVISTAKHLLLVILLRMLAFVDTYVFAIMALKPVDIAEAAKMVFSHITRFRN